MLQSKLKSFSLISFQNTSFFLLTLPVASTEAVQEKVLSLKTNFQVTSSKIKLQIRHSKKAVLFIFLNSQMPMSFNGIGNVSRKRLFGAFS
jgi:hypothetical protein